MAKNFGNTWWGKEWLRALDHIDHTNRLPRGATYARKGMVESISITNNQITAQVAGSRPRPYSVKIVVPPFLPSEVELLMNEIVKRPVLISKLLNRELDPQLLTITKSLGLKVFPRQWQDLRMTCSCPDYAVPCKHLASVVYMVSREIDNNPFVVFEMHNVNIPEELKKRGIYIQAEAGGEIPKFSDLRQEALSRPEKYSDQKVNFTAIKPIGEALIRILADNPPFCAHGDFKEIYGKELGSVIKTMEKFFKKGFSLQILFPNIIQNPIHIGYHDQFTLSVNSDTSWEIEETKDVNSWLLSMLTINPDRLPDYQPSVAFLHQLLMAAIHLLTHGAIIPQIVEINAKRYAIRWLPATMDSRIAHIVAQLTEIHPKAEFLLSLFLSKLIQNISNKSGATELTNIFFGGHSLSCNGVGRSGIAGSIKAWLERYNINRNDWQLSVYIEENSTENGFDISIQVKNTSNATESIPLSELLSNTNHTASRFKVLQPLTQLSSFITGLDEYINQGAISPIQLTNAAFAPFLLNIVPAIQLLGIQVALPKSLHHLLKPRTTMRIKQKTTESQGFIGMADILAFDWQIAIGNNIISIEEYQALLNKASRLIKFKGNYIYISDEDAAKIHQQLTTIREMPAYKMLQIALTEEFDGAPITLTEEVSKMLQHFTSNEAIPLPQGIQATLRPYQERGFSWMYRNLKIGFGSILADDMGLGKTLQVITLLQKLKEEGTISNKHQAIVVAPTGLLSNWQREINRFAPTLQTEIYHGANRNLDHLSSEIVITTYGTLRSDSDILKKKKWLAVIIDEAQNIKNADTAQTKAVKTITAPLRIAMSGTPVENRLSEFWSIMEFSNKGYLGSLKNFKEEFATPIQLFNDEKAISRFRQITSPFMMRRLKTDKTIISDLPDKVERNCFAILTKEQAALYKETLSEAMKTIEDYSQTDEESLFKRQGLILQMILALKQVCNHPTQFLKNGITDPSLSGKTLMLLDLVESIVESNEKVLIFTQFREMGDLLKLFLTQKLGEEPMFYHGGSSLKEREKMVDRFQNNRSDKVFILSLKAAGTGLNLTAATHVIHYDLWWNPAVEAQATDRAYRIGQHKNVQVHRFITQNTFEEKINAMIQAKRNLAEMTVTTGENWIGKLSNKELKELFS